MGSKFCQVHLVLGALNPLHSNKINFCSSELVALAVIAFFDVGEKSEDVS